MSTANRIIKNTGYLYAKMGITMFVSLYTTRLILNSLGASDFGIFNIVGGAIAMLGFLNAAMASATQRFMSYAEGEGIKSKQKSIFNVSFVLHILISLLVGIALLVAGYFFFNGILNIPPDRIFAAQVVYGSLIISTMFTVMTVPYDAVMNAHENMLYYAIVGIIESLLKLAVAFACVYTTFDKLIVYGILMACIPLITLTIMRIYCHKHYEECIIAPKRYFDKGLMKEMTSFAGWNFLGSMSSIVGNNGYGIIANHFFSTIVNAAMGIAVQLNGQLMVFSNNMTKAINPVIVKKEGEHDRKGMIYYSLTSCKYSYLLMAFFAVPFLIETPFILKLWLKNVPDWTILFVRLQIIRAMLQLLTQNLSISLSATGKIKEINISSIIFNLIPLPILWIIFSLGFPPYWLYIIAIVIMDFSYSCVRILYCKKYCQLKIKQLYNESLKPSLLITLSTVIIGILPTILLEEGILRLGVCILLSFAFFVLISFRWALSRTERENIYNILQKIKTKITCK